MYQDRKFTPSLLATSICAAMLSSPVIAQNQGRLTLEEVVVTAQKREVSLQDAALSIAAVSGEVLEKDRNISFADLGRSIAGFSYTGNTTFDQELNMRGVTNTRVDAPSGDSSIGVFMDGLYVGRMGLMNIDMYDIERVEVVRGPQGVLLGKNVVGGALTVFSKAPERETSGSLNVSLGNYDSLRTTGYLTGALGDNWSGRLSFQQHKHDGYVRDVLNNRDMEDLDSLQVRGQLAYAAPDDSWSARFIIEYSDDNTNGLAGIALDEPAQVSLSPWSKAREQFGQITGNKLDIRETAPFFLTYFGESEPTPPQQARESISYILDMELNLAGGEILLNSITGFRDGKGHNVYDQTGIGPRSAAFDPMPTFIFSSPVNENESTEQYSQEFRLTSNNDASAIDWIVGVYYQVDDNFKRDRLNFEIYMDVPTLNGESHWHNRSENKSTAVFGQLGYRFSEQWKITAGARYTEDDKDGFVRGDSVRTGDYFHPDDLIASTTLSPTTADLASFNTDYEKTWQEFTPQLVLEYTPSDDALVYLNVSKGYKGGTWEDIPANVGAANSDAAVDPETVTSYELGGKFDFFDGRARLNAALFYMDYKDLQVAQTKDTCNCTIIDNASDAEITGTEIEFTLAATENLLLWLNGSYLDTEYIAFVDSQGNDNSGEFLQRTPDYQFNVGAELTLDAGNWHDAITARINYSRQGEMSWHPEGVYKEDPYGLLDARITLTAPNSSWSVSVWGKNLSDEEYRNHVIPFLGDAVSFFAAPRTYGVDLGFNF